uniref:CCHC-type domain-containing protein n=1 Tax=Timema genevievae TaxID=629358 RepID=A0A7R9K4X5_TIMGE|nr:unnamed protein product [Timema genevievae]
MESVRRIIAGWAQHENSVIQMSGFRSLGDEEEVEFECKNSDKGLESTLVTGLEGADCCGSHRRPTSKKRFRKIRCYNCGEFANHIAAKCTMGPQPKRCHNCKSQDHLIADCPTRLDRKKPSLITIVNELEHEDNGTGGNFLTTIHLYMTKVNQQCYFGFPQPCHYKKSLRGTFLKYIFILCSFGNKAG